MLDKLFAQFRKDQNNDAVEADALPLAFTALLVEAARADEEYTDEERAMIDHLVAAQFGKTQAEAKALRDQAEQEQAAANDLYGFSRVVKEGLDREGKLKLIEDMWMIALTDEQKAPYEEMIIRRLVGLIHLEDTDSTAARHRAAQRLETSA
ncbi:TerB family tellurite resistance protein [Parvularcula sp. LCG005]|uniref:tellurite resistance TerB family protein n=1 Tax=Parvularcula sp. LCG005 TaxID=3078805 RepID=UPI00294376C8|nr:TerB family tellurite resistance protein [Parvularcula sp. LCG005]WOI54079.1 TerB family tellurite resistance protein [Parvularcula sp. LCG005]